MAKAIPRKNCIAYAKTAQFEGAVKTGNPNLTLETLVRQIVEQLPLAKHRKTATLFGDQYTALSNFELYASGGIAIAIDCFSPKNEASTVKNQTGTGIHSKKTAIKAKKGESLVKYEAFAYISGNNLLVAGDTVKDYLIDALINELGRKASLINSDQKIKSVAATVKDKIKQVNKHGVSKIELNISAFAHDLEKAAATDASPTLNVIKDILSHRDAEQTLSSANLSYTLVVDISKMKRAQLYKAPDGTTKDPADQWAKHAAANVLEDYMADYTITLRGKGGSIRRSELKISRMISVIPHGKSFHTEDMWSNLSVTYHNLINEGLL